MSEELNLTTPYVTVKVKLPESHAKSTNRNRNTEVDPEPIPHSGEQLTQPKCQYGGGPVNYRLKVAKIRQLNVDEPYFRPNKNKDGIIMYIVDHQWWQTDDECGGERSDKFAFSAISKLCITRTAG